jgi:hypothetical protein
VGPVLFRRPPFAERVSERVANLLAALGTLLVALMLAAGGHGLPAVLIAAFLVAAPATAVAVPSRGLDPLARTLLALAAAVVVNTLVAEGMVATGRWSIPGGIAAVGVISTVIRLVSGALPACPGAVPAGAAPAVPQTMHGADGTP